MITKTVKRFGFVDVMTNVPEPRPKTREEIRNEQYERYKREEKQKQLAKQKADAVLAEKEERARKFRDLIADARARQHW